MLFSALIFPSLGRAQDWQPVTPNIPPDIPTTITAAFDEPDLAFLTGEHNGVWMKPVGSSSFAWAFVHPYQEDPNHPKYCNDPNTCANPGLGVVHMGRLMSAPGTAGAANRVLYSLNHHGGVSRFNPANGKWIIVTSVLTHSGNDPWVALAIDATNAARLLAGGTNLIRQSIDSGDSWQTRYGDVNGVGPLITDIKYAGTQSGQTIWAATSDTAAYPLDSDFSPACATNGLLRSTNSGSSWTALRVGNSNAANCIYSVAPVLPPKMVCTASPPLFPECTTAGNCLYAATKDGLWLTKNGMVASPAWQKQTIVFGTLNLTDQKFSDVLYACGPTTPTVYAATAIDNSNKGNNRVVKFTSAGGWESTNYHLVVGSAQINAIGGTPRASSTLYVASESGHLHQTTDSGTNFAALSAAHSAYPMATAALVPANAQNNDLYVGTVCQGGLFQSKTDGTWNVMLPATIGNHAHFHYVMRLVQHPTLPGTTYVTDQDAVYHTTDGGASWFYSFNTNLLPGGAVHLHGLALGRANGQLDRVYAGTGYGNWGAHSHGSSQNRMFRGKNGGFAQADWVEITGTGFPQPLANLCCHEGEPGCNPATSLCQPPLGATSAHCGCSSVFTLAVHPTNPNILYAGTSELGTLPQVEPPAAQIYKGIFDGVNWTWTAMSFPPAPIGPMVPRLAWSDRYRVRDIQAIAPNTGQTKAYAVIEGSGIYSYNVSNLSQRGRGR